MEDAWAAGQPAGKSEVFSPPFALGGTGTPAAPAAPLVGLTSFNIHLVPEPSTTALGLMGAGTLLFLGWRQRRG